MLAERADGVRTSWGSFDMITRHPYRSVGAVLAVCALAAFISSMIGQFNDGPWGGLPAWLGTVTYAVFMIGALVLIALSVYLGVANLRYRRAVR